MTNEAVSSISVNSGAAWTGEIQTKLIGVWLDYGLLLVTLLLLKIVFIIIENELSKGS